MQTILMGLDIMSRKRMQRVAPGRTPLLVLGLWTVISALCAGAAFADTVTTPAVRFNRDIRPLFSDTCFPCHGFDANKRKAELRLDTAEGATALHKGKPAVKGGDLKGSELWPRINSVDPKVMMPPPDSGKKLNPQQRALIGKWREQGGKYQK